MTITASSLTRTAGLSAAAAGLLFIGVQIKHPHLDASIVTTTEWTVREGAKILMAALALIGITGMYLRQIRQSGVLGLLGYLVFSVGYLVILSVQVVGVFVLPTLARSEPGYVNDVLTVATGGHVSGDIGPLQPLMMVMGLTYLGGGLLFGIALFRADILARWASALLAVGTLSSVAIPLLPQINERVFALPTGIALVGLGYSLWREQRPQVSAPVPRALASALDPAGLQ